MSKEERPSRWIKILQLDPARNLLKELTDDFKKNHPDQRQISADCSQLPQQLPMFEEKELGDYLELLLTFYCKQKKIAYVSGLHEVLATFFLIGFSSLKTVYAAFHAFVKQMLPRVFLSSSSVQHSCVLFHRLLMYHEPGLCNALDAKMVAPAQYAAKWFKTLFSGTMNVSLLIAFWEFCLQEQNASLPYFLGLAILNRTKDSVLSKKNVLTSELEGFYIDELGELDSLVQEALVYQTATPASYIKLIEEIALQKHPPDSKHTELLESSCVLPSSLSDLKLPKTGVFVIDLRRAEEYLSGHYPQSFNFPAALQLSTEDLWSILTGFSGLFTNKTNRPTHFAFCCSKKAQHRQSTASLCIDIARRGVERVSIISEGYTGSSRHDWEQCQWCELNRDLVMSSEASPRKADLILNTMWYAFLHEVTGTPPSSNASSPCTDNKPLDNKKFSVLRSGGDEEGTNYAKLM